jgi:hypothetical protein
MSGSDRYELAADLELFRTAVTTRSRERGGNSGHWELGFGPVGGERPIWGLYHFTSGGRLIDRRELLWRRNPARPELVHFCLGIVGPELAAGLVDSVGDLEGFYDGYFASRPDLLGTPATVSSSR